MSRTPPPATVTEVVARLARVRAGLQSQRDEEPEANRSDYDRGQITGAMTGLDLALRLLGQLPDVDVEQRDPSDSDATGPRSEDATILPFERP